MITTKAYITAVPEEGNIYRVNVPLMNDNVKTVAEFDALVCSEPTNYNNYEVGDCVWVTFENDQYNTAVILGKLFVENPVTTKACGVYDSLKVINDVELPEDVKIGKYTAKDIFDLFQATNNLDEVKQILKKYVKWDNTVEDGKNVFANTIKCMTGETFDNTQLEENYLYFLTTVPPSEKSL